MGKSKIEPPEKPDPNQFSQLNQSPDSDLAAIRDHLLLVMSWNSLHDQMHLDNLSKQKSDEINKEIQSQ